jgi:hypothetical protein
MTVSPCGPWIETFLLLAQSRLSAAGIGSRRGLPTVEATTVLFLAAAVILGIFIACVVWGFARRVARRDNSSPHVLFHELCRAHQIGWSDRRLLRDLASYHELPHAAGLFVEPQRLAASGLDPALTDRAPEILRLQARLFGRESSELSELSEHHA